MCTNLTKEYKRLILITFIVNQDLAEILQI